MEINDRSITSYLVAMSLFLLVLKMFGCGISLIWVVSPFWGVALLMLAAIVFKYLDGTTVTIKYKGKVYKTFRRYS